MDTNGERNDPHTILELALMVSDVMVPNLGPDIGKQEIVLEMCS